MRQGSMVSSRMPIFPSFRVVAYCGLHSKWSHERLPLSYGDLSGAISLSGSNVRLSGVRGAFTPVQALPLPPATHTPVLILSLQHTHPLFPEPSGQCWLLCFLFFLVRTHTCCASYFLLNIFHLPAEKNLKNHAHLFIYADLLFFSRRWAVLLLTCCPRIRVPECVRISTIRR